MSAAGVVVTILYPTKEDATFDLEYYTSKHIPMAKELWGNLGMTDCTVCSLDKSSGYLIETVTRWTDMEAFNKAIAHEKTKDVMGDVKNFCNIEPTMLVGTVV